MKKIVALVLSLVMVLGLATTAFGASGAYFTDDLVNLDNEDCNLVTHSYELKKHVDEISVTRSFETYAIWETTLATKAPAIKDNKYYVLAKSAESADIAFVDGSSVTYLAEVKDTGFVGKWDENMVVEPVDTVKSILAAKCGDVFVGNDYDLYEDAKGDYYIEYASGNKFGYVDGEFVKLAAVAADTEVNVVTVKDLGAMKLWVNDATLGTGSLTSGEVYIVGHTYNYDADVVNTVKVVKNVYCTACDAKFDFVVGKPADAIKAFGSDNYTSAGITVAAGTVYVAKAPVAADAPAVDAEADKVESADTFDAGIAMYVGMSVMAAAGSAVVLKKKD